LKNIFLTLSVLISFLINAQTTKQGLKTDHGSSQKKYGASSTQNLINTLQHDTCLNKKFSIVFYVIQDSLYSLPNNPPIGPASLASYSLTAIINLLNSTFARICVSFENCKTVIIPNYSHNKWKAFGNGNMIVNTYFTENTINVYIPTEIQPLLVDDPEAAYSYSPAPGGPSAQRNAIVLEKGSIGQSNAATFFGSSILHAFGIFFGLPHTYDEINPSSPPSGPTPPANCTPPIKTLEYVDHTNISDCHTHGDGFCDTEADPYPSSLTIPSTIPVGTGGCSTPGPTDGYNNYYVPPTDNFMSHYPCRCRFTQEQYNYMAYIILTKRMYLH